MPQSTQYTDFLISFQPPVEDVFEDEKSARKSPPESEKETKGRDVSLSMAPLPIPLGPLGGLSGNPDSSLSGCKVPHRV